MSDDEFSDRRWESDHIRQLGARHWCREALKWVHERGTAFPVAWGSDEWQAWDEYFYALQWRPYAFQWSTEENHRPIQGSKRQWTAPCRWPDEFGPRFAPPIAHGHPPQYLGG
jgi:hypothetical protein